MKELNLAKRLSQHVNKEKAISYSLEDLCSFASAKKTLLL